MDKGAGRPRRELTGNADGEVSDRGNGRDVYPHRVEKNETYVITFIDRETRQIVGHKVSENKSAQIIQGIADSSPKAESYHSDGYAAYAETLYHGNHHAHLDKSETYTVEGVNSDLRKYIPGFARRSKCFYRRLETVIAVMAVFVRAFNKFALKKYHTRKLACHNPSCKSRLHKYKESPFALIHFLP